MLFHPISGRRFFVEVAFIGSLARVSYRSSPFRRLSVSEWPIFGHRRRAVEERILHRRDLRSSCVINVADESLPILVPDKLSMPQAIGGCHEPGPKACCRSRDHSTCGLRPRSVALWSRIEVRFDLGMCTCTLKFDVQMQIVRPGISSPGLCRQSLHSMLDCRSTQFNGGYHDKCPDDTRGCSGHLRCCQGHVLIRSVPHQFWADRPINHLPSCNPRAKPTSDSFSAKSEFLLPRETLQHHRQQRPPNSRQNGYVQRAPEEPYTPIPSTIRGEEEAMPPGREMRAKEGPSAATGSMSMDGQRRDEIRPC